MGKTSGNLSIPFYLPTPASVWETKSCPTETTPALWKQRCNSSPPLELFVQKFGGWWWLFAVSPGNGHSNHGTTMSPAGLGPSIHPSPWTILENPNHQALVALSCAGTPSPAGAKGAAPSSSAQSGLGSSRALKCLELLQDLGPVWLLGVLPEEQHMVVWSWSCSIRSSWVWDELWGCHRAGAERALRAGMRLKVPPTQTSLEFSEPPNQGLSPHGHLPSAAGTADDAQTSPDFVITVISQL